MSGKSAAAPMTDQAVLTVLDAEIIRGILRSKVAA
jgi:hypothetical protein